MRRSIFVGLLLVILILLAVISPQVWWWISHDRVRQDEPVLLGQFAERGDLVYDFYRAIGVSEDLEVLSVPVNGEYEVTYRAWLARWGDREGRPDGPAVIRFGDGKELTLDYRGGRVHFTLRDPAGSTLVPEFSLEDDGELLFQEPIAPPEVEAARKAVRERVMAEDPLVRRLAELEVPRLVRVANPQADRAQALVRVHMGAGSLVVFLEISPRGAAGLDPAVIRCFVGPSDGSATRLVTPEELGAALELTTLEFSQKLDAWIREGT